MEKDSIANLGSRTCWLIGREREVVDIPVDNPACSGQHAVVQWRFRAGSATAGKGSKGQVKLYVMDLESANGTSLNGAMIEKRRFLELLHGDVLRFGVGSTREWVVIRA